MENENQIQIIKITEKAINYVFHNKNTLIEALTHPSANANINYERLEFLGDSVLGSIVASEAYSTFPNMDEGKLTHIKVALVSGENLSKVAQTLNLDKAIQFGRSENSTGRRGLKSALENVYEAIVGAIYLDGGTDAATDFVKKTLLSNIEEHANLAIKENPKSELQVKLQANKITPVYSIINEFGPAHNKTFVAEVKANNKRLAQGEGKTKKEAETNAAQKALKLCI